MKAGDGVEGGGVLEEDEGGERFVEERLGEEGEGVVGVALVTEEVFFWQVVVVVGGCEGGIGSGFQEA